MSKQQIIEAIQRRNRTADHDFLTHFDEHTLSSYLQRLTNIADHRGRNSRWVRPDDTTAIVTRFH